MTNDVVKVFSATNIGLHGQIIEIQADVLNGLPATHIVGLPDSAVDESKERVRAAIKNSNFKYPEGRVVINLAPADLAKTGSGFDLPIAIAILAAAGHISPPKNTQLFIGELGLDGQLRAVPGILSHIIAAQKHGFTEVFIPAANAPEASLVPDLTIYTPDNLSEIITHIVGATILDPYQALETPNHTPQAEVDFADIAGQSVAKRALEIAAAGGHNILFHGPPGSGKTLLARALASILPPLTKDEIVELTNIYSAAGLHKNQVIVERPIRHPHHSTSSVALIGGGTNPKPGEVTLAHKGVLFMDEFPEFPRSVLEALRQPLEDGEVTVSRAKLTLTFPAQFTLVAAQNPCPCGNYGSEGMQCVCAPTQITRYSKKISGPLLDRIDLHIEVPRIPYSDYKKTKLSETSKTIREKVIRARSRQHARLGGSRVNAHLTSQEIKKHCVLSPSSESFLQLAADHYHFSGRAIHRILKVARTIADLDASDKIEDIHIQEAISYRSKHT